MAEICVGIDLGTTYSSIGLVGPEGLTLVPNVEGLALTPSAVQVRDDEVLAVGAEALRALRIDPDSVLRFFKRDMGTETGYWCGAHRWSPVELSAALLQSLRSDAERFLGETVRAAVITVPAYFEDDARRATIEAAAASRGSPPAVASSRCRPSTLSTRLVSTNRLFSMRPQAAMGARQPPWYTTWVAARSTSRSFN